MENLKSKIQNPKSFNTLRRFARASTPLERCELCGTALASDHAHLFEPTRRQLICACDPCAVSIGNQAGTAYRRVPQRSRALPGFQLSDSQWDGLMIPVGMAFFFYSTPTGRVMAFYPSPAGATESLLNLETWTELVQENPTLGTMEPDVEALLVNRTQQTQEYYLAPIDKCYELVGLIRTSWRGLSGGTEVWEAIGKFYTKLREQADQQGEHAHAGFAFPG